MPICTEDYNNKEWFCRVFIMSGFFYSFTFAHSLPNIASTIYSCSYPNGELDGAVAVGGWIGGGLVVVGGAVVLAIAAGQRRR